MAKKTTKEPAWGSPDAAIPTGLPGRGSCIQAIRESEAANEATLAGRGKQKIVAAAVARATKKAKGK